MYKTRILYFHCLDSVRVRTKWVQKVSLTNEQFFCSI